ncbi:MAG: FtsX-like permease family protein [Nitrospirae bacterium]|nr:FtsX-like permease family protein [Nitrospirota bacterium]MBF0592468.1 FtsX-like permease family protein [Nitrospirota bacterium]
MNLAVLAGKNLRRKLFRTIALLLSVTVVAGTLFVVTTIMDSVETSLQKSTKRLGADIMVVPAESEGVARMTLLAGKPSTFYMDKDIEDKVAKIKGVKKVAGQLFIKSSHYRCCDTGDLFIVGFEPDRDFTITPWLVQGLKKPLGRDEAIMGRAISAYTPGVTAALYGKLFSIVGMLEQTGMEFIDKAMYVTIDSFKDMVAKTDKGDVRIFDNLNNKISTVLVQVSEEYAPRRVAIFIEHDIPNVKAIVSEDVIAAVRKQLFALLKSILYIIGVLWFMSVMLIGVVFSMIVNERQREFGILRAVGAKRKDIFSLLIYEASFLSLSGGVIGVALGGLGLFIFQEKIKALLSVPYMWPSPMDFVVLALVCILISLLTGCIAALQPALRSMRMEPYAQIRGGE